LKAEVEFRHLFQFLGIKYHEMSGLGGRIPIAFYEHRLAVEVHKRATFELYANWQRGNIIRLRHGRVMLLIHDVLLFRMA